MCAVTSKTEKEKKSLLRSLQEAKVFTETTFKGHLKEHGDHVCSCISCGLTSKEALVGRGEEAQDFGAENNSNDVEDDEDDTDENEMLSPCGKTREELYDLKNKELQEKLRSLGKPTSGTKTKLIDRLLGVEVGKTKKKKNQYDCDYVKCPHREGKTHKGPCKDCEKSFEPFSVLMQYADEARRMSGRTESELEEYHELSVEIVKRRQHLIDLRSHIVRLKVEADYDRKQSSSLGPDECIVVCDFKMKILAEWYREKQKSFFGKRGTTCLGFMVMKRHEREEGEEDIEDDDRIDVSFYLFFSDDTTQDANFVLSAKAALYDRILPGLFPAAEKIKVHFRADGAGCFNSNLTKAAMPQWITWTDEGDTPPVDEVSYRVSVNGGGKSSLDGNFGQTQACLKTHRNNGNDIINADDCVKALKLGNCPKGTSGLNFHPDRSVVLGTKTTGLNNYYELRRNPGGESLQCYRSSGYGAGVEITIESINKGWTTEGIEEMGVIPSMPEYSIAIGTEPENETEWATYSTESRASRDKKKQEKISASSQMQREEKRNKTRQEMAEAGLFQCTHVDEGGKGQCTRVFESKKLLNTHIEAGNHEYKRQNLTDTAVCEAARPGGILAAGSRNNRFEIFDTTKVVDGSGLGRGLGNDWCESGCYLKPQRKPNTTFTIELKIDLLTFYLDGETEGGNKKSKAKYTKEDTLSTLKDMKKENGLKKYSSTSSCGPLPSIQQIGSIYYQHGKLKAEKGIAGLNKLLIELKKELETKKKERSAAVEKENSATAKKAAGKAPPKKKSSKKEQSRNKRKSVAELDSVDSDSSSSWECDDSGFRQRREALVAERKRPRNECYDSDSDNPC